jgi:DNA-binding GntR family transcriptional regulator
VDELAARYDVSPGTVYRAMAEFTSSGLIAVSRVRRAVVANPEKSASGVADVVNLR